MLAWGSGTRIAKKPYIFVLFQRGGGGGGGVSGPPFPPLDGQMDQILLPDERVSLVC